MSERLDKIAIETTAMMLNLPVLTKEVIEGCILIAIKKALNELTKEEIYNYGKT